MNEAFAHNIKAAEIGLTSGRSGLLGEVGKDLNGGDVQIIADPFVNRIIAVTLAAQVGNHTIGLRPCAGTGDSCPYTGFVKTVKEFYPDDLICWQGSWQLSSKSVECTALANALPDAIWKGLAQAPVPVLQHLWNWQWYAEQMEKAIALAISPTIAVPCTPRVLVPGLCATHIGGGVLIARLASQLAMYTSIPSTVPLM